MTESLACEPVNVIQSGYILVKLRFAVLHILSPT